MVQVESYLLRWDFDKFRDQISEATKSYTAFGGSLRALVSAVSGDLNTLQTRASSVTTMIGSLNPQMERSIQHIKEGTGSFSEMLNTVSQHGIKIASEVSRMKASGGPASGSSGAAMEQAQSQVVVMLEGAAFAGASVEIAQENAENVIRVVADTDKKSEEDVNRVKKYLESELEAAAGKAQEIASHVPGGILGGGVVSGLLAAMVLGVTERDRLKAQKGEMLNVIEASGEAISSDASRKVTSWFSQFQETAQWYYGISREETQGVLKAMVDAGYKAHEIMATFNSSLGAAGQHVGIMSIALDKHFNQDTGTSISNITKITTSLGDSLQEATDKYSRIAFAGQKSAMGISKFTDTIISGASAMQQYGVDVAEVAGIMGTIQKHYEKMGLSPQYAGNQATNFINGISQGIAGMDPSMKAMIAQRMFPELTGVDARQKWEDGFKRARQSGSEDFVTRTLLSLREWASQGGKTRAQAIRLIESKIGDNRTAAGLYDATTELAKGNKLSELSVEQQGLIKNALSTESEKISDLAKLTRDLTNAISAIGQGLLKVLAGLVGAIVLSIKYLPEIIAAALPTGDKKFLVDIRAQYDKLGDSMSAGIDAANTGLKDAAAAMKTEFKNDLQPIIDVLKWDAPSEGGVKTITSAAEAKAALKELKDDFLQMFTDEEFKRQLDIQAAQGYAHVKAWFLRKLYDLNSSSFGRSLNENPEQAILDSHDSWEDAAVAAEDLPDKLAAVEKARYKGRAKENASPEYDDYQTEMPENVGGANAKVDGGLIKTASNKAEAQRVPPP
jgi:hypothetical protein